MVLQVGLIIFLTIRCMRISLAISFRFKKWLGVEYSVRTGTHLAILPPSHFALARHLLPPLNDYLALRRHHFPESVQHPPVAVARRRCNRCLLGLLVRRQVKVLNRLMYPARHFLEVHQFCKEGNIPVVQATKVSNTHCGKHVGSVAAKPGILLLQSHQCKWNTTCKLSSWG